ncbi:uncharacterized protein LOC136025388 isoform X2 [Artemia franciscana]|uniref:uncharacterized protein LOC136025388 isoform X2 n=1 Tax=Artemia franciscana TaxID=6661 RepID=UPI0032D9F3B8
MSFRSFYTMVKQSFSYFKTNQIKTFFARPAILYTTICVKAVCHGETTDAPTKIKWKSENLQRSQLISRSAVSAVHICLGALIETSTAWSAAVKSCIAVLEEPPTNSSEAERSEEIFLELRYQLSEAKKDMREKEILLEQSQKLMTAACELAFLAGEDLVSNVASNTLYITEEEVKSMKEKFREKEVEYLQIQKMSIEKEDT